MAMGNPDIWGDPMLWISVNVAPVSAYGYAPEQLVDGYSGEPAVRIQLAPSLSLNRVGHGLSVLSDGSLIIATSQDTSQGEEEESFFLIPAELTTRTRVVSAADGVKVLTAGDFGTQGGRVCREMPNGNILLGQRWYGIISRSEFNAETASSADMSDNGAVLGGWDIDVDDAGNVWQGAFDNIWRATAASVAAGGGGSYVIDKHIAGSNISPSFGSSGVGGLALDDAGGLYAMDAWNQVLRRWNGAAVTAMNSTPSNPAATAVMTSTAFENQAYGTLLDTSGNMWISVFKSTNSRLLYFTRSQIETGGAQTPSKTVTLSQPRWATMPRFAPGYGLRQR